jgi:hypothetical protein
MVAGGSIASGNFHVQWTVNAGEVKQRLLYREKLLEMWARKCSTTGLS